MRWELRYSRDGFSVDAARKKKRKLPDWYLDEPPPVRGALFYFQAFSDLQTCRQQDGPIPWTAAMAYADRKELEPDVAEAMWIIVSKMDTEERRWQLEEMKRESGA